MCLRSTEPPLYYGCFYGQVLFILFTFFLCFALLFIFLNFNVVVNFNLV